MENELTPFQHRVSLIICDRVYELVNEVIDTVEDIKDEELKKKIPMEYLNIFQMLLYGILPEDLSKSSIMKQVQINTHNNTQKHITKFYHLVSNSWTEEIQKHILLQDENFINTDLCSNIAEKLDDEIKEFGLNQESIFRIVKDVLAHKDKIPKENLTNIWTGLRVIGKLILQSEATVAEIEKRLSVHF